MLKRIDYKYELSYHLLSCVTIKLMFSGQVDSWSTWSSGDVKFKNKIYSVKEVCYIDSGKFQITPEGGTPITVQAGDFVTFPKGFKCTWDISEPVFKHWKEY